MDETKKKALLGTFDNSFYCPKCKSLSMTYSVSIGNTNLCGYCYASIRPIKYENTITDPGTINTSKGVF